MFTNKKTLIWFIYWWAVTFMLLLSFYVIFWTQETNELKNENIVMTIVPHYMIATAKVDDFYRNIAKKYWKFTNIVILSPNHFGMGDAEIEGLCGIEWNKWPELCFRGECQKVQWYEMKNVISCQNDNEFLQAFVKDDKGNYEVKDHGIGEHISWIKKYFSDATLYPLMLSSKDFSHKSELLIEALKADRLGWRTLIIGSIDFSHHVSEDFGYVHDRTALYTMGNSINAEDYKKLEIDCQSCAYILGKLANYFWVMPVLKYRDSSALLAWFDTYFENTSRLFIEFQPRVWKEKAENGLTFALYGDTMYDRLVAEKLDSVDKLRKHFSDYYQLWDIEVDLKKYQHRLLFGFDEVIANMETVVSDKCAVMNSVEKAVNLCSATSFLKVLKEIGFTAFSTANNHSLDKGQSWYIETLQSLHKANIWSFGYISENLNSVYTGWVRWIEYVWHGYDFTTNQSDVEHACTAIKKYKSEGYHNFLYLHRWYEYQVEPSFFQRQTAEKLVDCGAELIVWTHAHVPQSIEYAGWVPVIYGLWNFLFDQPDPETKNWMYLLVDFVEWWKTTIITWSVNSIPKLF